MTNLCEHTPASSSSDHVVVPAASFMTEFVDNIQVVDYKTVAHVSLHRRIWHHGWTCGAQHGLQGRVAWS
ncbi:unnamed protein product [Calypogeia fissa]